MDHSPLTGTGALRRSSLQASTGRVAAVATALLLVVFLVLSVSRAAFTAQTGNSGNTVATSGAITLTDNDANSIMFTIVDAAPPGVDPLGVLPPTNVYESCIRVEYAGDFSSGDIQMYATNIFPEDPGDPVLPDPEVPWLPDYLNVKVETRDTSEIAMVDDPLTDCSVFNARSLLEPPVEADAYNGTLADFPVSWATGYGDIAGTAGITDYKVTITVEDNVNAVNLSTAWDFVWETQSP